MSAIEEIGAAVASVAETAGPSVVTIGRNARGSGVVIADGQVLTNAHNLRGGEVTVTFGDGRSTRGTVTGVDPDGDLAVVSVDTAGATRHRLGCRRRARGRLAGLRRRGVVRRRRAGHVRARLVRVALVPRAGRPADRRERRAHRAAGARLVGWRDRRCGREVPRAEHEPDRRGLLPRPAGRCRAAGAGRCAGSR